MRFELRSPASLLVGGCRFGYSLLVKVTLPEAVYTLDIDLSIGGGLSPSVPRLLGSLAPEILTIGFGYERFKGNLLAELK
jgi:hypothetical protein